MQKPEDPLLKEAKEEEGGKGGVPKDDGMAAGSSDQ